MSRARPPRKRFGQHFLTQPAIARRIVALAGLDGTETVLEVGPGRGALSGLLLEHAARLVLVEIDRDLAAALRERYRDEPRVQVVEGDVLGLDLPALIGAAGAAKVVANLPYNVSTPVLMQLLETPSLFSRLVLMLQREVVERLAARPSGKDYGALSVMVQLVADVRTAFLVSPGCFTPRPKVDSAVVVIDPHRPQRLSPGTLQAVRRVVRGAFTQRRKQLGNALGTVTDDAHGVLARAGISPVRRPETLSPNEFVRVAEAMSG